MKLLLFILLIAVAFWLIKKQAPAKGKNKTNKKQVLRPKKDQHENPFKASSITTVENSCDAAKTIAGKRYLLDDVPVLPLTGCDNKDCQCKYQHHDDRRAAEEDRRAIYSVKTKLFQDDEENNQRKNKKSGRRSSDQ